MMTHLKASNLTDPSSWPNCDATRRGTESAQRNRWAEQTPYADVRQSCCAVRRNAADHIQPNSLICQAEFRHALVGPVQMTGTPLLTQKRPITRTSPTQCARQIRQARCDENCITLAACRLPPETDRG